MRVRVRYVVPRQVVDCGNIPRDALRESFAELFHQRLALIRRSFHRQGQDETLANPPFPFGCLLLCENGSFRVALSCQTLPKHAARRLLAGDVSQMGSGLPVLGPPRVGGPFFGESPDGVFE